MSYWTSFKLPDSKLIEEAKTKGKKTQANVKGEDLEIYHYTYQNNGFVWYFENLTTNIVYMPTYEFSL